MTAAVARWSDAQAVTLADLDRNWLDLPTWAQGRLGGRITGLVAYHGSRGKVIRGRTMFAMTADVSGLPGPHRSIWRALTAGPDRDQRTAAVLADRTGYSERETRECLVDLARWGWAVVVVEARGRRAAQYEAVVPPTPWSGDLLTTQQRRRAGDPLSASHADGEPPLSAPHADNRPVVGITRRPIAKGASNAEVASGDAAPPLWIHADRAERRRRQRRLANEATAARADRLTR